MVMIKVKEQDKKGVFTEQTFLNVTNHAVKENSFQIGFQEEDPEEDSVLMPELIIIPMENIKRIEIYPQPAKEQMKDVSYLFSLQTNKKELKKLLLSKRFFQVIFLKKDGTDRKMVGTIQPDAIPVDHIPKAGKERPDNPDLMAIFSIGDDGWRSFRIDSLLGVPDMMDSLQGTGYDAVKPPPESLL